MAEVTAEVTVKIGNARVLIEALIEVFPRRAYGGPVFEEDPSVPPPATLQRRKRERGRITHHASYASAISRFSIASSISAVFL
jgi:hypothetical protein